MGQGDSSKVAMGSGIGTAIEVGSGFSPIGVGDDTGLAQLITSMLNIKNVIIILFLISLSPF
jgi:hypothetical protein